ncbi:hypothetical protein PENSPDRAFT_648964 [Peniophora sp. CONT]|nr:hypothetical protein PENSPDRAFT_648964 [Peniophora sp. CONT]
MSHRVNLNSILPVEVLTTIIVDRIVDDRSFTSPPSHVKHSYLADVALSISHVCRLWRTIALGPSGKRLWTHAPSRHTAACVEAFMQRSHPLPVFLRIEAVFPRGQKPTSSSLPALQMALRHSARVNTMTVEFDIGNGGGDFDEEVFNYGVTEKYLKMVNLLDHHSFPALEYMSWTTWINIDQHTFSPNFFKMEIPASMKRLFLQNTEFNSSLAVLRAPLTSLVLHQCGSWSGIDDFITTLRNMPFLETLAISSEGYSALDSSDIPSQHHHRSVQLCHLTRLALHDTLQVVPLLFTCMQAPKTCRVDLRLQMYPIHFDVDRYWDHWGILESALREHFESTAFTRLTVSGAGKDDDRFSLCALSPTIPALNIGFNSHYQEFNRLNMRLLRTLCNLLSLPCLSQPCTILVRNIDLFSARLHDRNDNFTPPSFATVREIIVTRSAVDNFVHALLRNLDRPLLPALQSIGLRETLFCGTNLHVIEPILTSLIGAVVAREHLGAVQSVKTIDFSQCRLTETAVDLLAEAVPNVEVFWDERCLSPNQLADLRHRSEPEHEGIMGDIIEEAQLPY